MPTRLLVNAKWRLSPTMSGVQRYASGLEEAIQRSELQADFACPPRSGRIRTAVWEQQTLPKLANGYDALLCPANMAPSQLHQHVRLLVTIHCLRFLFHPSSYSPAFVRWYRHMIPKVISRADTVFTVSESQKIEIEGVYPNSVGKVELLPPGLDPAFKPGHPRHPAAPTGPYLLSITTRAPAKNLATLIRAYSMCPDQPPLVLVGVSSSEADIIVPSHIRERVIAMGSINDAAEIASLLSHALLLLSPSRYESFGLPCLEGMGCGVPVLASDIPAHRELCREAAAYADPDDADAWASRVQSLSSDAFAREQMKQSGLERASLFKWSTSIQILERVLHKEPEPVAP